jgi:AraC-like DNA-binding protein
MRTQNISPDKSLSLYVKNIMVFEDDDPQQKTVLPFFADGYPGLIYQQTDNGLVVTPHNKRMPAFFLYGQTIHPVELVMHGRYRLIIMQLYPFVLKSFFQVNPKSINDNCYDLMQVQNQDVSGILEQLKKKDETEGRIDIICNFLRSIFDQRKQTLDYKIREAIQLILDSKGKHGIKDVSLKLKVNERTLERRFVSEVGIPPKQFSQITQFHHSLEQLSAKDFKKLTDIVYTNGFADQSHFIRVFKKFTGKTPKSFREH